MNIRPVFRYAIIILIISVNIGCDQVSKHAVRNHMDYHEQIQLLNDNVMLIKVENSGAFLSLGDSLSPLAKSILLSVLPSATLLLLVFWLFGQNSGKWAIFGLCCIAGGGIGNIYDRIMFGSVTDFMYLHYGIFRTGIFNFADVSITFGTCLIVLQQLFVRKNPR